MELRIAQLGLNVYSLLAYGTETRMRSEG